MVDEVLRNLSCAHPGVSWARHTIMTAGDRDRTSSLQNLSASSGAGVFASAVEKALLGGEIDIAVHSLKDLPTTPTPGTLIAAIPRRHDVRDTLCGTAVHDLRPGQKVGTSAPRRIGQLRRTCPQVMTVPIRGNVPPRLRQMRERGLAGVLLAAAGLHRLGMGTHITQTLDPVQWPPSPAQGTIALQVRAEDTSIAQMLAVVHDMQSEATTRAERALMAALDGGCYVPIGAYASEEDGRLHLVAQVTSLDGFQQVRVEQSGPADSPEELGAKSAEELSAHGAGRILNGLDSVDPVE